MNAITGRTCLLPVSLTYVLVFFVAIFGASFPSSAAEPHACDYLTRDDVLKVVGGDVGPAEAQPANPMGQSVCYFDIPAGMKLSFAQLQMVRSGWVKMKKLGLTAPSHFDNTMSYLDDKREISGLGERAYWGGSGLKIGSGLHVLAGDAFFTVLVTVGDDEANLDKSRQLAELIISRLKQACMDWFRVRVVEKQGRIGIWMDESYINGDQSS